MAWRVGFIGAGKMATALARGLVAAGFTTVEQIVASDVVPAARQQFVAETKARAVESNLEVVSASQILILAVKPQQMSGVLAELKSRVTPQHLVISIAAGVPLKALIAGLGAETRLVRVMPNTPCLIGEGMTFIARGPGVSDSQAAVAMEIFRAVGRCVEAEDKVMDAVTSLNGSGPAFAYMILEALTDGGVRMGLRRDAAMEIAAQMVQGAARMVLQTGMHPAALKDQVTTPAGCTIAGLLILEDGRIRSVVARAVEEAAHVASKLGQS